MAQYITNSGRDTMTQKNRMYFTPIHLLSYRRFGSGYAPELQTDDAS